MGELLEVCLPFLRRFEATEVRLHQSGGDGIARSILVLGQFKASSLDPWLLMYPSGVL